MNPRTEKIYNIAVDFIELRLNKKEQLLPFVVVHGSEDGKPTVSMYEQVGKDMNAQLKIMRGDLREKIKEGGIIALCLCYDVRVVDPRTNRDTDAIQIELAAKEIDTVNIYVPYNFDDEEIVKKPFQIPSVIKYF